MPEIENRTQRRAKRRRPPSKAKQILPFIGLIAVLALAWVGWDVFFTESDPKDGKTTVVKVEPEQKTEAKKEEKVVITQRTFVILGVTDSGGSKTLSGAVQVVFDPAQNRIGGLFVDPDMFVVMPGRGLQSISDGFNESPKALAAAISTVLGIKSEGYLIIDDADFARLKVNKDIGRVFEQYSDGNVPRAESKELGEQMTLISKERRDLYDVPVRQLEIGESLYYEPVNDELNRLVKAIWGREPSFKEDGLKVIILNGNGTPGIGRKAADRLIGKGYQIIDVKNADSFDYATTRIMVYNKAARRGGKQLAKDLGLGTVVDDALAQDVTDVVILLGKDFL